MRVDGTGALERRKLLVATAGLLGAREEAAGLRREVSSLQGLVARLREDEVSKRVHRQARLLFHPVRNVVGGWR